MKYIVTDRDEVVIGSSGYHSDLAKSVRGKVVGAGHVRITQEGELRVYGESLGYGTQATQLDLLHLGKNLYA